LFRDALLLGAEIERVEELIEVDSPLALILRFGEDKVDVRAIELLIDNLRVLAHFRELFSFHRRLTTAVVIEYMLELGHRVVVVCVH